MLLTQASAGCPIRRDDRGQTGSSPNGVLGEKGVREEEMKTKEEAKERVKGGGGRVGPKVEAPFGKLCSVKKVRSVLFRVHAKVAGERPTGRGVQDGQAPPGLGCRRQRYHPPPADPDSIDGGSRGRGPSTGCLQHDEPGTGGRN